MGIDAAIHTALSGLRANQEALATISQNIANANTENYARRKVELVNNVIGGIGQGVKVADVVRIVDAELMNASRVQASSTGRATTIETFYDEIQVAFGKPDSGNSLNDYVDNFFGSLRTLTNNPELSSARLEAVQSGVSLAEKVSSMAEQLEALRYKADQDVKTGFTFINNTIKQLADVNTTLRELANSGNSSANITEQRDTLLQSLSEYMDIAVTFKENGTVQISTAQGTPLLDDNAYQIQYNPATSRTIFEEDGDMGAVTLVATDSSGKVVGIPTTLITGGVKDEVTTKIKEGKIKGLLEMRDTNIPKILDQLDNFADNLRDVFNAIHNDGAGFPATNEMTSTRLMYGNQRLDWEGAVRIAVLQENGEPIPSAYTDEPGGLRPLTLDLGSLDMGYGAGQVDLNTIINEINEHFGPPKPKVSVGNLTNITLASTSNVVQASGQATFDFELDNISTEIATFQITAVSVSGGGSLASALPGAYSINPGNKARTGSNSELTLNFGAGAGPYFVDITVVVTDESGNAESDTIRYQVPEAQGVINDRYTVDSLPIAGGNGAIQPGQAGRYLTASFVDADGNTINATGSTPGYLKLTTSDPSFSIAMDELTSKEHGLDTGSPPVIATERGFSHYFELNDFFVSNGDEVKNSAINLSVRQDIIDNPNRITIGELTISNAPVDPDDPTYYTYELAIGNNKIIERLSALESLNVSFSEAGTLPSSSMTFNRYSAEIISYSASRAVEANTYSKQQQSFLTGFKDRADAVSGVNLDEELANTIVYQNAYSASARIISVTQELYDALFQAV